MRIGFISRDDPWTPACHILGHEPVPLPAPDDCGAPDALALRIAAGDRLSADIDAHTPEILIDQDGDGMAFLSSPDAPQRLDLVHETRRIALCSRFTLPVTCAFGPLPWNVVWQSLQSTSWVKLIPDRSHALELMRFGCPNVLHLPAGVPPFAYDTTPLDPSKQVGNVSFVGEPTAPALATVANPGHTEAFAANLARAARLDNPAASFFDVFFNLYGLGQPVTTEMDPTQRTACVTQYFAAKQHYLYHLALHTRDRYVVFLSRALPQVFRAFGTQWQSPYGVEQSRAPGGLDSKTQHYRKHAINVVLPDGFSETGLSADYFEVAAAGGFMLCRHQPELEELFDPERECATFRTEAELYQKIGHYLNHPDERVAIAAAGQRRVLLDHVPTHRLRTLLRTIRPRKQPFQFAASDPWEDIRSRLPAPDVILDCGAHAGSTAVALRRLFPHASIYSFEPVSHIYERLCRTCEPLGVTPVQAAVAEKNGTSWIHLTASDLSNSILDYEPGNPCARWTREVGREQIRLCRLDDWCDGAGINVERVDLLKLDVQGAELMALRGAPRILRTVRLVYLEVSFETIYKDLPLFDEIDAFLRDAGLERVAVYPSDQPQNWGDALYRNPLRRPNEDTRSRITAHPAVPVGAS